MERRGLHDVVAAPVSQQVPPNAEREPDLRTDAPPPVRVQLRPAGDCDDVHVRHPSAGRAIPLEQREVRDCVPTVRQALREVAIPPLGAADGMRIQAVENEADAHEMPSEGLQTAKEVEFRAT